MRMREHLKGHIARFSLFLLLAAHLAEVSGHSQRKYGNYGLDTHIKRNTMAISITPLGLCWEFAEGSTFAFWSYNNAGGDVTVEDGPTNQFSINGAVLETNIPPTNFTGGEMKDSASLVVNLGPTGLVFAWTIADQSAILNGSDSTHSCPLITTSVVLNCDSSPSGLSSLVPYISSLIPINESRISVELSEPDVGYTAAVQVSFAAVANERSSVWASNRLFTEMSGSNSVKGDIEALLSATISRFRVDTTGISDLNPLPPPPPPKYEIRVGTIVGIVFASVFGTSLLIIAIFTVIFRLSAYLEEKRMNRLANSYYGHSKPLIDNQPQKPSGNNGVTSVRI